jgi:hypothetical protein
MPTLFDNRNLLLSIIQKNWGENSLIDEIIEKIPNFITRVLENQDNKILVYYGDYYIDKIYDMNEFMTNRDLWFFKVKDVKYSKNKKVEKERFIILTDIYFLLFEPIPNKKNFSKLVFWGDVRQIASSKGSSTDSGLIELEWKGDANSYIKFSFIFEDISLFMDISSKKIIKLRDSFSVFEDDMFKPNQSEKIISIEKLILLIHYKEQLFEQKHSINLVRELMTLYQKIIEIMSVKNDQDFTTYLTKLQAILTNEDLQKQIEREKNDSKIEQEFERHVSIFGISTSEEFDDEI